MMIFEKSKNAKKLSLKNKNIVKPLHLISNEIYNYFTPYNSLSINLTDLRKNSIQPGILWQEISLPNKKSVFIVNAVSNLFNKSSIIWDLKSRITIFSNYIDED